jgi:pilus assembly protein FimV
MAKRIAAVVFSLGCLHTSSALALGLGDIELESFLNEPLRAEVGLLNTSTLHEDQIRIRLATKEDFKKMGVDRAYFLTSIKFDVEIDASGRGRIILTSEDPVLEPYLDFIIEARWPSGRLLREYTVLVDPPLFDQSTPVISASEQVAVQEGVPAQGKKNQQPAVTETTGTKVDVRNSNLAPGEMPKRDFNADTVDSPASGERYMIHRDDTLWQIASRARPQGASVHQTMLDIQRLNPHAFIDGNINRIKAGYILYLPASADISSSDEAAAMENVRQQNEDWRAGRASTVSYSAGPSLRISAEEGTQEDVGSVDPIPGPDAAAASAAAGDDTGSEQTATGDSGQYAALERRVETLQRIVTLKDEQIAALQAALAEAEGGSGATGEDGSGTAQDDGATMQDAKAEQSSPEAEQAAAKPSAPPAEQKPQPKAAATASAASEQSEGGGILSYVLYALGAAILAVIAFLFWRRRREDNEEEYYPTEEPEEAVFADVKLKEQSLDVRSHPEKVESETTGEAPSENGSQGYGEHKHDQYAADMEAGDAIAEADIYVAYGRYNQAIDLLSNAATAEPANPAYQLKLLEIYLQTGDEEATERTYALIQAIGEEPSISRAVELMADSVSGSTLDDLAAVAADAPAPVSLEDELDSLELDVEPAPDAQSTPGEELELAPIAETAPPAMEENGEELMVASDSNGLSSKLDLARAYLDMGDEDGARQILEEITVEGSDELKAEARTLLDRIG